MKVTDFDGISVADYGKPEYIEGAVMQCAVYVGESWPDGDVIAYFDKEEDAVLFAKAKKRVMKRVTRVHSDT